jgi:dynein heavy chain
MDQGGWYDLDNKEYKFLEDITFVGAMGPPSQGRNKISLRCSRHFNILYAEPYSANSMKFIFTTMMDWFF